MKSLIVSLSSLLLFSSSVFTQELFPAPTPTPPPLPTPTPVPTTYDFSQIKENFSKYVVMVQGEGNATGFIIHKNFLIINNHSVPESKAILIFLYDGDDNPYNNRKVIGEVRAVDAEDDLALVYVEQEMFDLPELPLPKIKSLSELETANVFSIGNPKGWEGRWSYTKGYVTQAPTSCEMKEHGVKLDVITACLDTLPGSSGSLIINEKGEFIGMTMAMYPGSRFTQIIPSAAIHNFMGMVYQKAMLFKQVQSNEKSN